MEVAHFYLLLHTRASTIFHYHFSFSQFHSLHPLLTCSSSTTSLLTRSVWMELKIKVTLFIDVTFANYVTIVRGYLCRNCSLLSFTLIHILMSFQPLIFPFSLFISMYDEYDGFINDLILKRITWLLV